MERIASSVGSLKELYTIVFGLAFTYAADTVVQGSSGKLSLTLNATTLMTMTVFVATMIPFYHGASRHLDEAYIFSGGIGTRKQLAMLADYLILFFEGGLFVWLALLLLDLDQFLKFYLWLLALDAMWVFIVYLVSGRIDSIWRWALLNVITVIIGFAIVYSSLFPATMRPSIMTFVAVGRTFVDYLWNWRFYFPTVNVAVAGAN